MLKETTLAAVADAMAAIDPAETVARLAENERQTAEIEAATKAAQAEAAAISAEITDAHRRGPDRDAAAEALLKGGDVMAAAKPIDALEARREALSTGLAGLRRRADDARSDRRQLRHDLDREFGAVGNVIAPALEAEAKALVERLARLYATARLAGSALQHGPCSRLATRLGEALDGLAGRYGHDAALIERHDLEPDAGLLNALDTGSAALEVARRPLPSTVPFPTGGVDTGSFVAGMYAGAALRREQANG